MNSQNTSSRAGTARRKSCARVTSTTTNVCIPLCCEGTSPNDVLCCGGLRVAICAVDVWAVGCILAELTLGKPLFPGRDSTCVARAARICGPLFVCPTLLCADTYIVCDCVILLVAWCADIHQMQLIFQLLGTPSDDDMKRISSEKALDLLKKLPFCKKVNFKEKFAKANPLGTALCLPPLCCLLCCLV
jgi:hypothetical protein